MSGRILPAAIATIFGIGTGVYAFDGEFKAQRARRLENQYRLELAAVEAAEKTKPQDAEEASAKATQAIAVESRDSGSVVKSQEEPRSGISSMLRWARHAKGHAQPIVDEDISPTRRS